MQVSANPPGRFPVFLRQVTGSGPTLVLLLLTGLLAPLAGHAKCLSSHAKDLAKKLDFQGSLGEGEFPGGWHVLPEGAATILTAARKDRKIVRLQTAKQDAGRLTLVSNCIKTDFHGKTLELEAELRPRGVKGPAGLWFNEYSGNGKLLVHKNMKGHYLHGTSDWKTYSLTLSRKKEAQDLVFGVLLKGSGSILISNLRLLVDGKPIWESPRITTVNDTDRAFDNGSGIAISKLDATQIANLVTLGKVWGFLKYYDPTVTAGHRQWDYALFRVLPKILAAPDKAHANAALLDWIKGLGPVPQCKPCVKLDGKDLQLKPDLGWIGNQAQLGKPLSTELQRIFANRRDGAQFYVAVEGISNPIFQHERPYEHIKLPDPGFQLLALFRYWNVIEYWYPDRNLVGENWDHVLEEFIPRLALAKDRKQYTLRLMALVAKIHDSHANVSGFMKLLPPVGKCFVPVRLDFVGSEPVVTGFFGHEKAGQSALELGDAIWSIDGQSVSTLVEHARGYLGASNVAVLDRTMDYILTRGPCTDAELTIRRKSRTLHLQAKRAPWSREVWNDKRRDVTGVLAGPAFQFLSPQVAYLNVSTADAGKIDTYLKEASTAKGLIIDMRSYPAPGMYVLPQHLIRKTTAYSRFTTALVDTPGAFRWNPPEQLKPLKPYYGAKVAVLVGRGTQSYGEYMTMALRAAPNIVVIGGMTAGADGNISTVHFPGGLFSYISGLGVFYPDKQRTQRIGIIPDVVVRPTVAGIRAGRDQVLEAGIRRIIGRDVPLAAIEKMYRPQGGAKEN